MMDWLTSEVGTYVFITFVGTAYVFFCLGLLIGDWIADRVEGGGPPPPPPPPVVIPPYDPKNLQKVKSGRRV